MSTMRSNSTVVLNNIRNRRIRLVQLAEVFIYDMKIKRNDTIFIFSALNDYNLADFSADDFTFLLKMLVGVRGTIVMSSVVPGKTDLHWGERANSISDTIAKDAGSDNHSGLLADIFRFKVKIIGLGINFQQSVDIIPGNLHSQISDSVNSSSATVIEDFSRNEIPFFLIKTNQAL